MTTLNIDTYRVINPVIYSWSTPDVPKYQGWEKIGYTEQQTSDARIAQQASQMSLTQHKNWAQRALFTSEAGGRFTDHDFHDYLRQQGVEREVSPKRTEWHRFEGMPKRSLEYFTAFASRDMHGIGAHSIDGSMTPEDYQLRPEQNAAVEQAITAFEAGHYEVLWNAKPRFGKTLTTYDLLRHLDVQRALIVTNRPAIAMSWYDDYIHFIAHQTDFRFVSESSSLATRAPMTHKQWVDLVLQDDDARLIEFLSLQDLKGSKYFGGPYEKLEHIAGLNWDILIIDEAHEGVDTLKTDIAFDHIKRTHTLHLSGTPFRALASGKFSQEQIYNWTYADEREALAAWDDNASDNPYTALPTLNMLTYQVSRMVSDQLEVGMALEEDKANIDYAFNLSEFFSTKDNGFFVHEAEVIKFLDCLASNEKYPFSTPELRDEIRHSFWLLDRVASAKALEKLLGKHEVFKDYTIVLAAGDGRTDETDAGVIRKSLNRVKEAIADAEKSGGRTITLSVGQLTTGVTVPEWTAVIMLSNLRSPAQYMQAAFRAQNPCTFLRGNDVMQKQNAYIFDFAPERTLTIYDEFANNLSSAPPTDQTERQNNIRRLLNFFPVIGEDSEGRMVELDATQVLTFPQVFKAREVVRRGFLSNLLFDNVSGIFHYSEQYSAILGKLPKAKAEKLKSGEKIELPEPVPTVDDNGSAVVDMETVINPKVDQLGPPVWKYEDIEIVDTDASTKKLADGLNKVVKEQMQSTRARLKEEYGLTIAQTNRDKRATEAKVRVSVERTAAERDIAKNRLDAELSRVATEAEAKKIQEQKDQLEDEFKHKLLDAVETITKGATEHVVIREEMKKEQTRANKVMDDARAHLRGFAHTIPMFLMAYGDRDTTLSNLDDYTPDDVFEEITGITEEEFRQLRDGQDVTQEDGSVQRIPGLFDEAVFNSSIQEFLNKKADLADYFDDTLTENIFAYIPRQKTSLVFTPQPVVTKMIDVLEEKNPGIFSDPDKTFADLFSTAGLFLMELVRRLEAGLTAVLPDQDERLRHIFTEQIFEMSHNEILHRITIEAVSGGIDERKKWIEDSGHFLVGNLSTMAPEERESLVDNMLSGRN